MICILIEINRFCPQLLNLIPMSSQGFSWVPGAQGVKYIRFLEPEGAKPASASRPAKAGQYRMGGQLFRKKTRTLIHGKRLAFGGKCTQCIDHQSLA